MGEEPRITKEQLSLAQRRLLRSEEGQLDRGHILRGIDDDVDAPLGVKRAEAVGLRIAGDSAEAADAGHGLQLASGDKAQAAPHPLYGPPDFPLVLPQARTRNGVGQTIKDLTDHPWAGAQVTMTLVAHDDGGNVGKSEASTFRLPQRVFIKPLARALVEQRRDLAMDANTRPRVITALDALAIAPDKFTPDGEVTDESTAAFLRDFMAEFREHLVRVLTVIPRENL